MNFRVGLGFDIHELIAGTMIKLAGVSIPSKKMIKAHSDGDIIYHSLADAILGALSKGDIGMHFPDSDLKNKNLDSGKILSHAYSLMTNNKYIINNIDITLILEEPKIKKYKDNMCQNISSLLHCNSDLVNIKATTSESIGFVGRGEGIACHAIVSIISD
ncbi:MAG: 2-C-methyl-D-erythritol 2,4-cyclodiphosphate synthase [Gammaproteobacteria bacterium]|nr:MAG: 2-C-methyl-D-erythritol 2,4-cyclodiphosphate synthase [Gammaproteobacteria bacterium]